MFCKNEKTKHLKGGRACSNGCKDFSGQNLCVIKSCQKERLSSNFFCDHHYNKWMSRKERHLNFETWIIYLDS